MFVYKQSVNADLINAKSPDLITYLGQRIYTKILAVIDNIQRQFLYIISEITQHVVNSRAINNRDNSFLRTSNFA